MRIQETLEQHAYTFYIIDSHSGEFTKYYSGSVINIIQQLERDPENSQIADVIKQQKFGQNTGVDGILSFAYDDHIYSFIPQ